MKALLKQNRIPSDLRETIRVDLRSRTKDRPVVISDAMRAVRLAAPDITRTSEELRNDIAIAALDAGLNIHFDPHE